MLLQADPTTAYGLGEGFDGNLRRKHLDDEGNPYNTYKHPGLPPGPLCSPGLACLKLPLTRSSTTTSILSRAGKTAPMCSAPI